MMSERTLLDPRKFRDPLLTAGGDRRATVALDGLRTLWFNTGTLCNIECAHCYIDSSPTNDRLRYLETAEVTRYLDEIARDRLPTTEIGFTGGEPFMNPDCVAMLDAVLGRGLRALVLTNAMQPLWRCREDLLALRARYPTGDLVLRVSLDSPAAEAHDAERGAGSWEIAMRGLRWLAEHGFTIHVAGRADWPAAAALPEAELRAQYAALFRVEGLPIAATDPVALTLFPEMDERLDTSEITTACWGVLDVEPASVMCASSRMVVHRRGAERATVVACTLIPDDAAFEFGETLAAASGPVTLNHPHCARFCVTGGGSCS